MQSGMPARMGRAGIAIGIAVLLAAIPAAADEVAFDLRIAGGRVDPAVATLRARRGDDVRLRITSDRAGTVHLHGYGFSAELAPQVPVTLAFTATATGRYPLHWHESGEPVSTRRHGPALAHVEVHPR